ncbi:ABC transporter substrate-binding protein [Streptomyces sp. NPDC051940]|uniref:ABC transporter substrate-binding protein n=1 Tax=Streptomyces sp. NPDC051940 TaxID=3155675 RepID=UPI00343B3C09
MTTHRSSRRRQAAASAVIVAALLSTAACGGGDGGSDDKDKGSAGAKIAFNGGVGKVLNASTKKGGTLKFIGSQDFDFLDPQRGYYGFMWDFARYYTRQLITYKAEPGKASTELVPDMASGLAEVSDGGKTYKYTLKDGVKWEDGQPVTTKDIKYGIERIWAQDVLSGGPIYLQQVLDPEGKYKGPYKDTSADKLGLSAIETPDDKTIIFKLPKANSDFEQMLAMPSATPVRQDKDTKEKYTLKPFSNGPYKIDSYTPTKGAELSRNPNWDAATDDVRKALPDNISVTLTTNADDMDKRLIAGEYDLDLNATGVGQAARAEALNPKNRNNVDNPQTGFIRYAVMPTDVAPFDNIECRKAVIVGADHKSLQTARGGPQAGGDIATNMLPPAIGGADPAYDPYEVKKNENGDVAAAKEHLAACGKPNGFKTTIAVRNNKPLEIATAESLQASLKKVGIDAQIDQFDGAQTSGIIGAPDNVRKKGYGIIIMGWGADFPTGQGFSQPLVDGRFILDSGNNNFSMLNDPAINKLFDDAIAATDIAQANEFYKQMNQKVSEAAVYLPFTHEKNLIWRGSRLTNVYTADAYNGRYDYASLGVVK